MKIGRFTFGKPSLFNMFNNLTKITGNTPEIRLMIVREMTKAMYKRKAQLEKKREPVTVESLTALLVEDGQEFIKLCEERFNMSSNEWDNIARSVIAGGN